MTASFLLEFLWMFVLPLATVIGTVLIGQRIGIYHRQLESEIHHTPIDSVVSAAFALLAFMLAFTFQIAANRYDARKALLIEEVKNIRTAYLRAGLLPEPYNSDSKKNLMKYIDLRADAVRDHSKVRLAISGSQVILDTLWSYTEGLARMDRSSEVYALFTSSINDVVDVYNERLTMVFVYRIPVAVLWVLCIIGFLSMLVLGYQFGVSGKGKFGMNMLLAVSFSAVMFLIFALDRPETGLIELDQKPVLALQRELRR